MESKRGSQKIREGKVISNSMDKTAVIAITRMAKHPVYGKYVRKTVKYFAHDERNECQVGDVVKIVETRPLSRHKRWRVQTIVNKAVEVE